jgi:hypothetical protein
VQNAGIRIVHSPRVFDRLLVSSPDRDEFPFPVDLFEPDAHAKSASRVLLRNPSRFAGRSDNLPPAIGKTIDELARASGRAPIDTFLDLSLSENLKTGFKIHDFAKAQEPDLLAKTD